MEHLLSWHTFDKTQKAVLKIGIFRALVDVFHCVPGALKCVSCSVFFFQTEHLPLQTQFQDREVGGLQHSVSNMVLRGGGGGSARVELVAAMLIEISFDFHENYFFHLSAI